MGESLKQWPEPGTFPDSHNQVGSCFSGNKKHNNVLCVCTCSTG
jgi:hypothetical protein